MMPVGGKYGALVDPTVAHGSPLQRYSTIENMHESCWGGRKQVVRNTRRLELISTVRYSTNTQANSTL